MAFTGHSAGPLAQQPICLYPVLVSCQFASLFVPNLDAFMVIPRPFPSLSSRPFCVRFPSIHIVTNPIHCSWGLTNNHVRFAVRLLLFLDSKSSLRFEPNTLSFKSMQLVCHCVVRHKLAHNAVPLVPSLYTTLFIIRFPRQHIWLERGQSVKCSTSLLVNSFRVLTNEIFRIYSILFSFNVYYMYI